jgi:hypothetical protein
MKHYQFAVRRSPDVTVQAQTETPGRREGANFPCNDASHAAVM